MVHMKKLTGTEVKAATAAAKESLARAKRAVQAGTTSTLDLAGVPFARPAAAWKVHADARAELRSEANRDALRTATVKQRDTLRDLRQDRKAFEKARGEVEWWNVLNGERRAAAAVVRDSRAIAREARQERRQAKKDYPLTLAGFALRCHAAHVVPTGVWAAVSESFASTGAFTLSVAAVAANLATATLGMRHVASDATDHELEALQPSQEERDLLHKLSPKEWMRVAEPRGLADVVSTGATLTASGIQAKLSLNGTMTVKKLASMEDAVRAALRIREKVRVEIRTGSAGGRARLTIRTRSAADGVELKGWKPGDPWGVDTVTGEPVFVPLGRRMLVAGTSGAGKSWSMRPVLAEASAYDDHRLVVFDAKRVEAALWQHRAACAVTADEMLDISDDLVAEMHRRLAMVERGRDTVDISPSTPRITVFVDEGAEAIALSKDVGTGEDKVEYSRIIENLRTLARMGRAAEIIILWATQKPSLSGAGHGLDTQIAGQITCRASLCVATQTEARVVFGEDAGEKGWNAHELPMPGVALLRDGNTAKPHPIRTRAFSPKDVIALEDRPAWSPRASWTGATKADVELRKSVEGSEAPTVVMAAAVNLTGDDNKVSADDRDTQVYEALLADPCVRLSTLAKKMGVHKMTVKRSLDRLEADGVVEKDGEGCWQVVG